LDGAGTVNFLICGSWCHKLRCCICNTWPLPVSLLVGGIGGRTILAMAPLVVSPSRTVSCCHDYLQSRCDSTTSMREPCAKCVVTVLLLNSGAKKGTSQRLVRTISCE